MIFMMRTIKFKFETIVCKALLNLSLFAVRPQPLPAALAHRNSSHPGHPPLYIKLVLDLGQFLDLRSEKPFLPSHHQCLILNITSPSLPATFFHISLPIRGSLPPEIGIPSEKKLVPLYVWSIPPS